MPEKTVAQGRYDRWTKPTGWPMAIVVIGNVRLTEIDCPEYVMDAVWVLIAVH